MGNSVLDDIAFVRHLVDVGEKLTESLRISGSARRMLIFTPGVKGETAVFAPCTPPGVIIKALLIGASIIIDDRLAQVVAVAKRRPANAKKITLYAL